ncbi:DUF692 domain-containing protein [Sneathiella sp.]|uniref:MNIO family bufferin maturase n=1 Tax=Sneathiella sp. TaxID=1964365 RepID=UPI003566892E
MAQHLSQIQGVGVGFKAEHFADILQSLPDVGFFEVHAENFMGDGGPPHARLRRLREDYALSVHGVGLSIGGADALDDDHLKRLKAVVQRYQPALVSEHLAWASHQDHYYNDLLALPYTSETLANVTAHVDHVQSMLGRTILLENPSTYLRFDASTWHEADFLAEIIQRTGCGLLLDINNIYVTSVNHGLDAKDYVDRLPLPRVGEIHLAGHADAVDGDGTPFLIDAHDRAVADEVLALYQWILPKIDMQPTLLEWDNDVPDWPVLLAEAQRIEAIRAGTKASQARYVA